MNKNKRLIEEKQDVFDFTSISGIWYQAPSIQYRASSFRDCFVVSLQSSFHFVWQVGEANRGFPEFIEGLSVIPVV